MCFEAEALLPHPQPLGPSSHPIAITLSQAQELLGPQLLMRALPAQHWAWHVMHISPLPHLILWAVCPSHTVEEEANY